MTSTFKNATKTIKLFIVLFKKKILCNKSGCSRNFQHHLLHNIKEMLEVSFEIYSALCACAQKGDNFILV